ncbi:hypothetical protein EDC04DRAFT_2214774 [Pisolithus marmoratus]|nr:hypothetical protein EDC04DRAFT_2214774 [Pisolithus marmoratus]
MLSQFLVELSVCTAITIWMQTRVVEPPAGVPWPGCMLRENPNTSLTLPAWIIAILVATIFLGLTLRLLYSSMKPMTLMLVKDSVLFYFPMFGVLVASVVVMAKYRTDLSNVTVPVYVALYSFCASRLIIHTRENFVRSSNDTWSRELETMNFASRSLMMSHAGTHA